jgi:hypothetical protein
VKRAFVLVAFLLTMLVWTVAQQPDTSGGQTSPNSQTPGASPSQQQPQPSAPGGQDPAQPRDPSADTSQAANQPITEGCLGGSNPNYTLTDKAGTTYKLNFPREANVASLEPHVGESVRVMGAVNASAINVSRIGRGAGTCGSKSPKK